MESEHSRSAKRPRPTWLEQVPIEIRFVLLGVLGALPAIVAMLILLSVSPEIPFSVRWAIGLAALASWTYCVLRAYREIRAPLTLIAGALRSFQEGDCSTRLVKSAPHDGVAETIDAINALGDLLRNQRLGATEALSFLKTIMEEVDIAIFTVDQGGKITWINGAAARLVHRSRQGIVGRASAEVGLDQFLSNADGKVILSKPSNERRLVVKQRSFYDGGHRHTLVVVSDLTQPLREEERTAWHRVIRVLSHEINNSLTPIRSLSVWLMELLDTPEHRQGWEEDLRMGLGLVAARSESLARFVKGYAQMAQLPLPQKSLFPLADLIRRSAMFERRVSIQIEGEGSAMLFGDPDQLEQALINIIRNAAEASLELRGSVQVFWYFSVDHLCITVRDEGPGLSGSENLFVPFFTTKDGGSGIGLALSRQIIEAHGGSLTLRNRSGHKGCDATIFLPLQ